LHQILQAAEGVVVSAVAGMGGLGKTELAVQYATRHLQDYPGGVCWLTARSNDLATQILQIAIRDLNLELPPEFQTGQVPDHEQVEWCWGHWKPAGKVLVVLDDVSAWSVCGQFVPKESRFRLLITTREQNLARQFAGISLDVLEPWQARDLLRRLEKAQRVDRDQSTADKLCAALGYLPLGIELVGRYLANDRFLTLTELWERLQEKGLNDSSMERPDNAEMTARLGVRAAFELTWQQLTEDSQTVARLLGLFAPDEIPWELAEQMMQRVKGEKYSIREAQTQLDNASVVQVETDALEVCRLHPLIREFLREKQLIVVETTEDRSLQDAFVSQLIDIASEMPQDPTTKDILAFAPVRAHLQEVAEHYTEGLQGDDLLWAFVGLASFYQGQGLLAQAEPWYADCLRVTQRLFEGDHPDIASSLNNLASLYQAQGRLSEAEPLLQSSLEMRQHLFEGDHPDVASSLNNLASLYQAQGRLSEAEPLLQSALEMRQHLFEGNDPDVASSLNNLASLYQAQGRLSEAEPLLQSSLEMRQHLFEGNHPDVASSLNNLAYLYYAQRRWSEAEPLLQSALEMRQCLFEGNHLDVALSLNNLAGLYDAQGRLSEAEPLYQSALEMWQRLFEGDHPDVALSFNNLAYLYQAQGRLSEAEPLYQSALEMRQRLFEGDHPDVALSFNNLAGLYQAQGQLDKAKPRYQDALAMLQRTLGINHPNTQVVQRNLASLHQVMQSPTHRTRRRTLLDRALHQIRRWIQKIVRVFRSCIRSKSKASRH
jgi:tetratricopeptide (TPR) repeat protein